MKGSKDLLSSALKTTQMGQIGIRSVLKSHVGTGLHTALVSQLHEYDSIEQEAHAIASASLSNYCTPSLKFPILDI